jgi:hypothetical protein
MFKKKESPEMQELREELQYLKNKQEGGVEMPRRNYEEDKPKEIKEQVKQVAREIESKEVQTQGSEVNAQEVLDAIDGHLLRASALIRVLRNS